MAALSFGIKTAPQHTTYQAMLAVWQEADANLAATTETVQRFVDAGATHLILNLRPPYPDGIVARLADEVAPRVRA
jgi:hypothetical protein